MTSTNYLKSHKTRLLNVIKYTKAANAYLQFYNWMLQTRKWSKPTNTPYTNKRIVAAMPDSFRMDYTKLPKRLEKLYKEENI